MHDSVQWLDSIQSVFGVATGCHVFYFWWVCFGGEFNSIFVPTLFLANFLPTFDFALAVCFSQCSFQKKESLNKIEHKPSTAQSAEALAHWMSVGRLPTYQGSGAKCWPNLTETRVDAAFKGFRTGKNIKMSERIQNDKFSGSTVPGEKDNSDSEFYPRNAP